MNMNIIRLNQSRHAYSNFAFLCRALNEYENNENDETTEKLRNKLKFIKVGMPLPSGRWGNALAVALEMQLYQGALFMIKNADELGINLESISSDLGGENVWNAQETFELSQLGFEMTKIADNDETFKDFPWLIQSKNSNIDAALEISTILQDKIKGKSK